MIGDSVQGANLKEDIQKKLKIIHHQIASLQLWVEKSGGDETLLDAMCKPYFKLLEQIYEEDIPLVKAITESDLVVKVEGTGVNRENPRVSLVAAVFSDVRSQVGNLAKAIAGIVEKHIPREMDLGLAAFGKGSLVLGFTLAAPTEVDEKGEVKIFGLDDPLYLAAKEAVRTIGIVTKNVSEGYSVEELRKTIPDPLVRDAALIAVKRLCPTGKRGISTLSIAGKDMSYEGLQPLTKESRKELQENLIHPVLRNAESEIKTFAGVIREIDLDMKRFQLRQLVGAEVNDIRCVYGTEFAEKAHELLNKKVKVSGQVEYSQSGKPRLLEVEDVEILPDDPKGMPLPFKE